MRAERHPNESARLDALLDYGILDTPKESDFDEIVALASRICDAPVALITLLDADRQWFKAAVGVEVPERPYEESLCSHAILQPGLTEVPDLSQDPRFADNAIVANDPNLRFYAGVPLETPEGLPIGTLCVIDVKARALNDLQRDALRVLGNQAMTQIELRRRIAEGRRAEENLRDAVEARTAELRQAVEEAEGFNYTISHDLRTPLRAMSSTSQMLLEEAGDALTEEHRELLRRQAHNAARLGLLIDQLLRLSRLGRVAMVRSRLDLTEIAESIVEELASARLDRGCAFDVAPGMVADGDPALVRLLLGNLMENACKFSPPGSPVRVREESGVVSVADRGIGFDMRYAPKVFLPFERLVTEAEFPGTGIGLANVERIVRRHGGRVWAESAPGAGATFYFTLG